jgi:hypothetical protein
MMHRAHWTWIEVDSTCGRRDREVSRAAAPRPTESARTQFARSVTEL